MSVEEVFKNLSPVSIDVLRAVNPEYKRIKRIKAGDFIAAVSKISPDFTKILKGLRMSSKSNKQVDVENWLAGARQEANLADSEKVDIHHLVFAFLLQFDTDTYYRAKRAYAKGFRLKFSSGLREYFEDITKVVKRKPKRLIGREKELTRLIVSLCSESSSPPLIIGGTGVGKTSLVFELANMINQSKVPSKLLNSRVIKVDFASLVNILPTESNVSNYALFSHLLSSIVNIDKVAGQKTILFLDNLRVGAGHFVGFEHKPKGDILLVGAARDDLHGKYWESPVLDMWDVIALEDQSDNEYMEILNLYIASNLVSKGIIFTEDAISKIIDIHKSDLILGSLPGGGIKTLDLLSVYKCYTAAPSATPGVAEGAAEPAIITEHDVLDFFEGSTSNKGDGNKTGLSSDRLLNLEEELRREIIGQDDALKSLAMSLRVSSLKLRARTRPVGCFLFLGPTGVGKTETAKVLAKTLFGCRGNSKTRPANFLRIDMTEYSEKHSVSKLFGAPPGYIGYDDRVSVCDFVSECPSSVLLFDEIDKAHPEVLNSLLHIMDEGEIRSNQGEIVSFEDVVIIMTSNHGAELINKSKIGFDESGFGMRDFETVLLSHVKKYLKPEFLNRFDDIVVFGQLSEGDLLKILDLMLAPIIQSLKSRGTKLKIGIRAKKFLVEKAFSKEYGARELRRVLNRELVDRISKVLLKYPKIREIKVGVKKKPLSITLYVEN